mmetsp:Transcript_34635/g.67397  ORF Transcript_34635/g.67397 Transcript_34635/m.67397 type:complete len:121 (-) Transcript_34635:236-598(-)
MLMTQHVLLANPSVKLPWRDNTPSSHFKVALGTPNLLSSTVGSVSVRIHEFAKLVRVGDFNLDHPALSFSRFVDQAVVILQGVISLNDFDVNWSIDGARSLDTLHRTAGLTLLKRGSSLR